MISRRWRDEMPRIGYGDSWPATWKIVCGAAGSDLFVVKMRPMRRLITILLMLLVPLQGAWSAGHALRAHAPADMAVGGAHVHVHGHGHGHSHDGMGLEDSAQADSASGTADGTTAAQEHGSHAHPAFTFILSGDGIGLADDSPAQPPPSPASSFTSHIPPLFDWPPAVRV